MDELQFKTGDRVVLRNLVGLSSVLAVGTLRDYDPFQEKWEVKWPEAHSCTFESESDLVLATLSQE